MDPQVTEIVFLNASHNPWGAVFTTTFRDGMPPGDCPLWASNPIPPSTTPFPPSENLPRRVLRLVDEADGLATEPAGVSPACSLGPVQK